MADKGEGRIFSSGDANTLFVSIPADVAVDSAFPFDDGQEVKIRIEENKVIVETVED
jgi:hypothetical protein